MSTSFHWRAQPWVTPVPSRETPCRRPTISTPGIALCLMGREAHMPAHHWNECERWYIPALLAPSERHCLKCGGPINATALSVAGHVLHPTCLSVSIPTELAEEWKLFGRLIQTAEPPSRPV